MWRTAIFLAVLSSLPAQAQVQEAWEYVGTPAFSDWAVICTRIAADPSGTMHVSFQDLSLSSARATVMKNVGDAWQVLGAKGQASLGAAYYCTMAFDANGRLFVASRDYGVNSKANVRAFDAASNAWSTIGAAGIGAGEAHYVSIAMSPAGLPSVTYADGSVSNRTSAQRFDGSAWTSVGPAGYSQAGASFQTIASASDGTLYTAYCDSAYPDPLSSNVGRATVMRYDVPSGAWSPVGNPGFSPHGASNVTLALDRTGTPWIAYYRYHNSIVVMRWTGTTWQSVGGSATGPDAPTIESEDWRQWTSLVFDSSNRPYVAYQSWLNGRRASVRRFDGTAWTLVGDPWFTPGAADYLTLALDAQDKPWIAFRDGAHLQRVSVMRFAPQAESYCTAVVSSQGCVPQIFSTGAPSLSNSTSFSVRAINLIPDRPGILLYGYAPGSVPFQGGTLCIGGPIHRGPAVNSGPGVAAVPCSGSFGVDLSQPIANGLPGVWIGTQLYTQFWYRDPQNPLAPGLTNALRFVVGP